MLSLKVLNEYVRCAQNMVAAQRFCFCAVACDNRIEDCHVFLQNGLRHLHIVSQDFAHDTTQIRPMRCCCLTDQWISRYFVEKRMELHVRFDLIVQGATLYRSAP